MSRYLETSCQSKFTGCWKRRAWFTHRRNTYAAMRRIALEVVTKIAEVDAMCVRRTWSGSHIPASRAQRSSDEQCLRAKHGPSLHWPVLPALQGAFDVNSIKSTVRLLVLHSPLPLKQQVYHKLFMHPHLEISMAAAHDSAQLELIFGHRDNAFLLP